LCYAINRKPSAREISIFPHMNSARIDLWEESVRNSGKVFLKAIAVTCSEGQIPVRIVRIQDPNEAHISLGDDNDK